MPALATRPNHFATIAKLMSDHRKPQRHHNSPTREDIQNLIGQAQQQQPPPGTPINQNVFSQDHEDQVKREKIPTIDSVPTMYRPRKNMLMVVPLPEMESFGGIIIPNGMRLAMNEGHVIAVGPDVPKDVRVGDCVTWDENTENRMEIDGIKFVLVSELVCVMSIPREELTKAAEERAAKVANLTVVKNDTDGISEVLPPNQNTTPKS